MVTQLVMATSWCGCGVASANPLKIPTNGFKFGSNAFNFSKPYPRSAHKVTAYYGLTTPPYELDALEPYMSKRTVELHWGKHHNEHVEKLNEHLKSSAFYGHTLEEMVKATYNNGSPVVEFNDASSVWNHDFFWESMQPKGAACQGQAYYTKLKRILGLLQISRMSLPLQPSPFSDLAGSGFIVGTNNRPSRPDQKIEPVKRNEKKLAVAKTQNAISPLVWGDIPIIGLDMWEHAYYLDYKDDRFAYVNNFLDHLVSWHSVMVRMMRAEAFVNLGEPKIPVV